MPLVTPDITIRLATRDDLAGIASLHALSWRNAYAGMLPDDFLGQPVVEDRMRLWQARLAPDETERIVVRVAISAGAMIGFACVLPDAEPAAGARLDNLHVHPGHKGHGIGARLFAAARADGLAQSGSALFHLWVLEANVQARGFYERRGGIPADRRTFELVPSVVVPEIRYVWR